MRCDFNYYFASSFLFFTIAKGLNVPPTIPPPIALAIETYYDSVANEPQPSSQAFHHGNKSCKPSYFPLKLLGKWVSMLSKHVGNVSGYYIGSSSRQATLWPLGIVDAWYMADHFNYKGKTIFYTHTIHPD